MFKDQSSRAMPIRNPFRKGESLQDENRRPTLSGSTEAPLPSTDSTLLKPSSAISIKSATSNSEPAEYKLSEINDSGVFLPPSPPERQSFRHTKSYTSTSSSNHRSALAEAEPFNMSRESFDSYRRSFDISARSPVIDPDVRPRHSLDARKMRLPSATSIDLSRPPPVDEVFEDVGLNDEVKPKKRSIFSRFGDSSDTHHGAHAAETKPTSHYGTHLFGRKRGQSGQGAELGSMKRPGSSNNAEVKVDS